ncbi:hypothetical protein COX68_01355 [Candidatus Falkowbacteria bacterium CG_4_10_14_0_2_um_filter_41_15]|uniref:Anticodon-binding domain-containing protein n=1 Tax=Candidatus Falkowbacteria bacterium CG_4_10_14_0_2_um_filter_41_15 TaxID=1974554 RepID=A0A2M7VZM9_9BACT|nr:MAG: hypothetical protein COX68_01355 [Candidatus Falkowbacteria bacterium CG_4_10_14_0_2_um_filter_41_15]
MGPDMALKAQMAYALNQGIRYVIFVGQTEAQDGTVQVKDTSTRKQEQVAVSMLAQTIRSKIQA